MAEQVLESVELESGTDVGGYLIENRLGSGGMGVVYAATHPLIGKRAAVKVLRHELSKDLRAVERFITEARSVNQIGHPNIVDIFAFGALDDGRNYYLMDLLVGESLRARLKRTGAMHISEAAVAIDEMASALIAAHAKGIVHRDLKPDNVFMMSVTGRWPEVKLLDWGLAKLLSPTTKFRTVTGALLGTPMYMSPEQARAADTVDARTDIYSLGVIAYELLAGLAPFSRSTSMETLLAHAEEAVPPLSQYAPALPEELTQLIEAMLAKDRDHRPTLAAVRTVLRRLKGSKIPTMTAAGLSMELPPSASSPGGSRAGMSRPSTDELRTIDDNNVRTRPPPRSGPFDISSQAAPATLAPGIAPPLGSPTGTIPPQEEMHLGPRTLTGTAITPVPVAPVAPIVTVTPIARAAPTPRPGTLSDSLPVRRPAPTPVAVPQVAADSGRAANPEPAANPVIARAPAPPSTPPPADVAVRFAPRTGPPSMSTLPYDPPILRPVRQPSTPPPHAPISQQAPQPAYPQPVYTPQPQPSYAPQQQPMYPQPIPQTPHPAYAAQPVYPQPIPQTRHPGHAQHAVYAPSAPPPHAAPARASAPAPDAVDVPAKSRAWLVVLLVLVILGGVAIALAATYL